MPFISIVECKNTTVNGNRCKSKEEIKRYLEEKDFWFIYQHTYVLSDMFAESDKVNEFPYLGDRENYFPTSIQQKSIDYGPIKGVTDVGPKMTEVSF